MLSLMLLSLNMFHQFGITVLTLVPTWTANKPEQDIYVFKKQHRYNVPLSVVCSEDVTLGYTEKPEIRTYKSCVVAEKHGGRQILDTSQNLQILPSYQKLFQVST